MRRCRWASIEGPEDDETFAYLQSFFGAFSEQGLQELPGEITPNVEVRQGFGHAQL